MCWTSGSSTRALRVPTEFLLLLNFPARAHASSTHIHMIAALSGRCDWPGSRHPIKPVSQEAAGLPGGVAPPAAQPRPVTATARHPPLGSRCSRQLADPPGSLAPLAAPVGAAAAGRHSGRHARHPLAAAASQSGSGDTLGRSTFGRTRPCWRPLGYVSPAAGSSIQQQPHQQTRQVDGSRWVVMLRLVLWHMNDAVCVESA